MRLEINGFKREVIIMQAAQGSYYCDKDSWLPQFPTYVGICEPITEDEENYGEVILFPIDGGNNGGYESIEPQWIQNDVSLYHLRRLIVNYTDGMEYDNLKQVVELIMDLFEIHKTPIPLCVREYVNDVMNGNITEIPTNE